MSTEMSTEILKTGYYVEKLFDKDFLKPIKKTMIQSSIELVFGDSVEIKDKNLLLFTDPALRKRKLDDPNCIWRNGNSRQPLLSKSCGMIDIHYNSIIGEN